MAAVLRAAGGALMCVLAVISAIAPAATQRAALVQDKYGNVHLNTSGSSESETVYINGVDVVQLMRQQSSKLDRLTTRFCDIQTQVTTAQRADEIGAYTPLYSDAVLAPNGNIYTIPFHAAVVVEVNPATHSVQDPFAVGSPSIFSWTSGVLAGNGLIYGIPGTADYVLVIDPVSGTANPQGIPIGMSGMLGGLKWNGAALADNGDIYAMPSDTNSILIVHPDQETFTSIQLDETLTSADRKFHGAVRAPNGKIYGIPSAAQHVLIVDPANQNEWSTISLPGTDTNVLKWAGGVLASNGKIYGIPFNADGVLIIDPITNVVDTTTINELSGDELWRGGVLLPSGRILGVPFRADSAIIIDPATNASDTSTISDFSTGERQWGAGVLAGNNFVYLIPYETRALLYFDALCL